NTNPVTGASLNTTTEMSWVSRPPYDTLWDDTEYTVVADGTEDYVTTIALSEAKCVGKDNIGDKVKRWELYNTAISYRN
ncbi:hypothetical protein U2060_15400, partial [Listeria monocytogenes]|uniref:hypothetical protein n=1 Tax=Listeria monocytogenes TaxID=1639 RepID=UPI002FDBF6F9